MMKSTVLCRLLLLFVFAFFCVLSHCAAGVRAADSNDVVQLIKTSKEVKKLEEDIEKNAVVMLTYYRAFNKSVYGVFQSLEEALKDIKEIEKEDEVKKIPAQGANAKTILQNLKEKLTEAKNKKDELTKLNADILNTEPEIIHEKIKNLLIKINESKTVVNDAEGNSHGVDSGVAAKKATELQNAATAARTSLEEISGKLAKRYKTVYDFFKVVLQANDTMGGLMLSVGDYLEKEDHKEQKEKFEKCEESVKTSFENAKEMTLASDAAQTVADRLVELCKKFEKNPKESQGESTTQNTEGETDGPQGKETQQTEGKRNSTEEGQNVTENDGENIVSAQLFIFMVTTTAALWLSHILCSF